MEDQMPWGEALGKEIFLLCSPDLRLARFCRSRSRRSFVQTVVSGRVSPEALSAIKHKSAGLYSSFPSGMLFNHVLNVLIYFRSMVIKRYICAMSSFTPFNAATPGKFSIICPK